MKRIVPKNELEFPEKAAAPRILSISFALLCLLGFAISVELTRIHVFVHTNPNFHSICALSEGVNCETVASSPYSVFLGLPVAVWGIMAYLTMGLLAISALSPKRPHNKWPWGILLILSLLGVAGSIALAYISATKIGSLCLFCGASYLVNIALLALSVLAVRRRNIATPRALGKDMSALVQRPALTGLLLVSLATIVGTAQAKVPAYWSAPEWTAPFQTTKGADKSGQHWLGSADPVLTIVEFSDYECPHCRVAHKKVRNLVAKHQKEIRLVHRHLPLDATCHPEIKKPFHINACLYAEATECAGVQGKFWEMNDALFAAQRTQEAADLVPTSIALRLGLDQAAFGECLRNHATRDKVSGDIREAIRLKLRGTPSFVIGDRVYVGGVSEDDVKHLLEPFKTPVDTDGQ